MPRPKFRTLREHARCERCCPLVACIFCLENRIFSGHKLHMIQFFFSPFYLFLMRMSAIKMKKKKKTWMNQQGILFLCVSRVNVCRVGLWQFSFFLMDSNTRICTRYHSQITKLHTLTLLDTFETTLIEFISKILFNCFFFFIVIAFVHFVSQHRKEV